MNSGLHPFLQKQINQSQRSNSVRSEFRSLWLDESIAERYGGELPEQKNILQNSAARGLPPNQVGPFEGHLMMMLLRMINAQVGVEFGTLGGYSTSWIARALQGASRNGRAPCVHTLELKPHFAEVARENLQPWAELLQVHVGPALEIANGALASLQDLDFVFIDADKANYPNYFDWAWARLRKGGVVLIDNFYLWGGIYAAQGEYPREYSDSLSARDHFSATQFAGMKKLWDKLEGLGESAHKTILPTSEGLGCVYKL